MAHSPENADASDEMRPEYNFRELHGVVRGKYAGRGIKTYVEFRSSDFPPYEGEEDEINPGRYGKRLAEFLIGGLKSRGFEVAHFCAEDWGWVIDLKNSGFRLWIGCGNYDEYPDGFLCFIEPHKPSVRPFPFFRKVDTSERIAQLQRAMDEVLTSSASVRDVQWWTHAEFNNPSAR